MISVIALIIDGTFQRSLACEDSKLLALALHGTNLAVTSTCNDHGVIFGNKHMNSQLKC